MRKKKREYIFTFGGEKNKETDKGLHQKRIYLNWSMEAQLRLP